jgi:branched-subunit amino acid aminotransferase/4-amino-4-deoxychorismate lyase
MEAIANGYVEGIALDKNGFVSEGSGENLFLVHRDKLITAPLGNSVLPGITRDSVLQIARDLNIAIIEQMIPREMLYIADEVFFTARRRGHHRSARSTRSKSAMAEWPDHEGAAEGVLCDRARRKE